MRVRACLVLSIGIVGAGSPVRAQDDVTARIAGAAMTGGGAAAFLQRLTDEVGGRVTGSPQTRAASELILAELRKAGYANARFEEFDLASRWTRGPASGRIVAPIDRAIHVGSFAWVPGFPARRPLRSSILARPPRQRCRRRSIGTAALSCWSIRRSRASIRPS